MDVRDLDPADTAGFLRLYAGYLDFYGAEVPAATVEATLRRALDPASQIFCRVAAGEGGLTGFAVCVLHEGTWVTAPVCYLEDLYVRPAFRRRGLARALLSRLAQVCLERGYTRLSWAVLNWNTDAITLYDAVGGVPQSEWTTYRVSGRALTDLAGPA